MIHFKKKEENTDFSKIFLLKDFFELEKEIDFNKLVYYMDMLEYNIQYKDSRIKFKTVNLIPEIEEIQNKVKDLFNLKPKTIFDTDIYASLNKFAISPTHIDNESVLIFCVYGKVIYSVYLNDKVEQFLLQKGDILHIPRNILHAAIPLEPRISLSIGFDG